MFHRFTPAAALCLVFSPALAAQTRPLVDHHQHLFSPAAIKLIAPAPAQAIEVPADVAAFLEARGRAADSVAMTEFYADDAQLALASNSGWISGRAQVIAGWRRTMPLPFRFTPIAFQQDGNSAQVGAYLTEGAGDSLRQVGKVQLGLSRQADGKWRIAMESLVRDPQSILTLDADRLIRMLDDAGIKRAVVLSMGYTWGHVSRNVPNEYERVKAENDWTSAQVAKYPDRLVGFCGLNPTKPYAMEELARCARDPILKRGLKLHFGNSDIDLDNPERVELARRIFKAANDHGMAIVVHMRTSFNLKRGYGRKQGEVFLNQILPAAPDVPVQIGHMAGGGGFDDDADEVLGLFAEAIARNDPRMRNVYFDLTTVAPFNLSPERRTRLAQRIRQLGVKRMLFGSDAALGGNLVPRDSWTAFLMVPLTSAEFETIASNVAPYLR